MTNALATIDPVQLDAITGGWGINFADVDGDGNDVNVGGGSWGLNFVRTRGNDNRVTTGRGPLWHWNYGNNNTVKQK